MVTINVLDYVDKCTSNEDGAVIFNKIYPLLSNGYKVRVSFSGVNGIPTSFVNSAFVELLDYMPFEKIKNQLTFVKTSRQINDAIKRRFYTESQKAAVC